MIKNRELGLSTGKTTIGFDFLKKEYQGIGLGKALVSECLNRFLLLEGDREIFLHTQTWSYKAIGLYLKAGFEIVSDHSFAHYKNDYDKALPILKTLLQ